MKGLQKIHLYLKLSRILAEYMGEEKFCIEDFKNTKPATLVLSFSDNKKHIFYCDIEDGNFHITDDQNNDYLLIIKKKRNLSDEQYEEVKEKFRNIIQDNPF